MFIPDQTLASARTAIQSHRGSLLISPHSEEDVRFKAARVRHGALDFDKTLLASVSWATLEQKLILPERFALAEEECKWHMSTGLGFPPEDHEEVDAWADRLERTEASRAADHAGWGIRSLMRMTEARVTREYIDHAFSKSDLRTGTSRLLTMLEHKAIVSYGVRDIIVSILTRHGFEEMLDFVYAALLRYDDAGYVTGFHPGSMVVPENKIEAVQHFLRRYGIDEASLMVLGDSVHDVGMMMNDSFNVIIAPRSDVGARLGQFASEHNEVLWDRLDLLLVAEGFNPLCDFLSDCRRSAM